MTVDINKFIEENKEHVENILFYSYDMFSKKKYAISLQEVNIITKTLGLKVRQNVQSFNYYTPEINISQSYTSSNYVTNFSRFYDTGEKITFINASNNADILKNRYKKSFLTYDEYIKEYGKLLKRKYYVKDKETIIDTSDDEYSSVVTNTVRYGLSIYEICDFTYKSASISKQGKNYLLSFLLDCQMSHRFFIKQIKNTGHTTSDPLFYSSEVEFLLDPSLNLISATSKDKYRVKFGLINLDIEMNSDNSYFVSESNTFKYKKSSLEINIPKEDNNDFDGYKLKK